MSSSILIFPHSNDNSVFSCLWESLIFSLWVVRCEENKDGLKEGFFFFFFKFLKALIVK